LGHYAHAQLLCFMAISDSMEVSKEPLLLNNGVSMFVPYKVVTLPAGKVRGVRHAISRLFSSLNRQVGDLL
jgi:hypothetical protein